jgi:hypothetical protein
MASKSKRCSDNPYKGCNRKPFVSDSSCDRGQVDTHKFDELPYCDPIDPIKPRIPPQVVDKPLQIEIPPPCNCIEIEGNIRASKIDGSDSGLSFVAVGDCCDGTYRMDLVVPCPITSSGSNRISVNIGYASDFSAGVASFVECGPSSCEVEFKDADINLTIPDPTEIMPPEEPVEMDPVYPGAEPGAGLHLKLTCGKKTIASAGADILTKTKNAGKMMTARTKSLNLELKCPVKKLTKFNPKIKLVAVQRLKKIMSSSQSFLDINSSMCSVTAKDVSFNLNLPCPIESKKGSYKIKLSVKQKNVSVLSSSQSFVDINSSLCEISVRNVSFNLNLPCSVRKKDNVPKNPKIRIHYKNSKSESEWMSSSYVEINSSTCEAVFKTVEFDLRDITGGGGAGRYPEPFDFVDCCVEDGEFFFDGELKEAEGICPGDGKVTVYLVCKGVRKDPGDSSEDAEYTWDEFYLSTSEVVPATGEKILNIKLYDLDNCNVLKDYRGVNLPVVSGGAAKATIDDYGPFPVHYLNGAISFIGDGYVQVGGYTIAVDGGFSPTNPNEFIAVKILSGSSSPGVPGGNIVEYSSFGSLRSAQHDLDYVIIPIYRLWWDNLGAHVLMDLRRMPMTGMLEVFLGGSSS